MSHDEAINDGATERYVLDEMTNDERDAFEEHYFDCAVCAEDLKAAIAIREGSLAYVDPVIVEPVIVEPAVVPFPPRRRRSPASLAAAASITMSMLTAWGMQVRFVAPALRQVAQLRLPSTPVAHDFGNRAEAQRVFDGNRAHVVKIPIAPDDVVARYTWTIRDANDKTVFPQVVVDGNEVNESLALPVSIQAGTLKPGDYKFHVISKRETDYEFTVR